MSLVSLLKGTGSSGFGYGSTAADVVEGLDLSSKTVLVTGCNSGIGETTVRAIAGAGATVVGAARTDAKADAACAKVQGDTVPVACELSEPAAVRECVERVAALDRPIDAIVCNAGIMALPELQQSHGYELQFFTNHVGHFILVTGLLDHMSEGGRVVMVASNAHRSAPPEGIEFDNLSGETDYNPWKAYGQSKLANILFAKELARRFDEDETSRVANAVHPGVIHTNLTRNMNPLADFAMAIAGPLVLKSVEEGAATQTWAAVHPDAGKLNGEYLSHCNVERPRRKAEDAELARRLWEETDSIVESL